MAATAAHGRDRGVPPDRYWLVWAMLLLGGAGFLFPFNSYIVATDFLDGRYRRYSPEFYIPMCYLYVSCAVVSGNLIYGVGRFSIAARVRFGYGMFMVALAMFLLVELAVGHGSASTETGFALVLVSVVVVAVGGGIQQSSFYGFSALMPLAYTEALMFGESLAGVLVSLNRVWTRLSYSTDFDGVRDATFLFFYVSIGFLCLCAVLHELTLRTPFSRYFTAAAAAAGGGGGGGSAGGGASLTNRTPSRWCRAPRTRPSHCCSRRPPAGIAMGSRAPIAGLGTAGRASPVTDWTPAIMAGPPRCHRPKLGAGPG